MHEVRLMSVLERVAYSVTQGARLSWYLGQSRLAMRLTPAAPPANDGAERRPMPDGSVLMRDLRRLFDRFSSERA